MNKRSSILQGYRSKENAIRKKLPPLDEILAVYGTIVFVLYGWTSITFSWKVPSWLYVLSLGEIVSIVSYSLASNLLECTTLLFIFLLLALLLPSKWLRDKFIIRASIMTYILTFWAAAFNLSTLIQLPTTNDLILFAVMACLTLGMAIMIAERVSSFRKFLFSLASRLTVFLYLWIPLSALGILVVVFRVL